jgi:hypothetical protein
VEFVARKDCDFLGIRNYKEVNMALIEIFVGMPLDNFQRLAKTDKKAAAVALKDELKSFNAYLESQRMDPMGRIEESIVREYIGWKLMERKDG